MTEKEIYHTKTKHVAMDLQYVRERVEKKVLVVEHISNKIQWADVLTKPLQQSLFKELWVKIVKEFFPS